MKATLRSFIFIGGLTLAACGAPATSHHTSATAEREDSTARRAAGTFDTDAFADYIASAVRDWSVPGLSVAVVSGDSVLLARGFGVRRLGSEAPVDDRTMFGLMSIAKSFTATAVGMLVDDGRLSWDDPVVEYVPHFKLRNRQETSQVTIRDLLSHRTGYQEEGRLWRTGGLSRREIVRSTSKLERVAQPRTGYHYSNVMYAVAGEVIETTAGSSWEDFLAARIFSPLGMTSTITTHEPLDTSSNVAAPHTLRGIYGRRVLHPGSYFNLQNIAPAGAIYSNARDAAQWLRFYLNGGRHGRGQLLGAAAMSELQRPHVLMNDPDAPVDDGPFCRAADCRSMGYALGWVTYEYHGARVLSHSGGIDGQSAVIGLLPDRGFGIVLLANSESPGLLSALMNRAFDLVLVANPQDWSKMYRDQS